MTMDWVLRVGGFSAGVHLEESWANANTKGLCAMKVQGRGRMLAQKALQDKNMHAMKIFGLSVKIGVFPSKVPVSGLKIRRQ